jgi:hypothetical protein
MSDRVSETVLLCEDDAQERFTKAYLKKCGLPCQSPYVRSLVASREKKGGNDAWVLDRFPKELNACRQRNKKAKTRLLVLIDADKHSVEDRRRQLTERVKLAGFEEFGKNEPAELLIPKRQIETWIRALRGEIVTEDQDCKGWEKLDKEQLRLAAQTLYDWSRPNATLGSTCVPSLQAALPQWRRIG